MPAQVVVAEDVVGPALDALQEELQIVVDTAAWSEPDRLHKLLRSADGLVVRNRTQVTRELIEAAPRLQVVARAGTGLDNIDLAAADDLGVVVVAASGANALSVAELAIGLALCLARQIVVLDRQVRGGVWERIPGMELAGGTWGVIGLGATGRATARLAVALGMAVCAYDPFQTLDAAVLPPWLEILPLPDMLARCDVVSLHLASSPQTDRLVDDQFLASMRRGALLINVARGELVDEAALLRALVEGKLGGAGLDVRRSEPPLSMPSGVDALARHPRVVSTPHIGGITGAAQERVVAMLADDLAGVLRGEPAQHAVGLHRRPGQHRR
jgi:D-3-phosphoglycerate dehydrogenase